VNHEAKTQVQIILLRKLAMASVVDPTRYGGNINCISGSGDVKVNRQLPTMVNVTDTISK